MIWTLIFAAAIAAALASWAWFVCREINLMARRTNALLTDLDERINRIFPPAPVNLNLGERKDLP